MNGNWRILPPMPAPAPRCPGCGETRLVEKIGRVYFCSVCAAEWE